MEGNNHKLKKNQLVALVNVIEKIAFNKDISQDKISKIQYWFKLKFEM